MYHIQIAENNCEIILYIIQATRPQPRTRSVSKTVTPGENERVGWGAIGFSIRAGDKTLVNLGDSLLHREEWEHLKSPDVLMIPIGGRTSHNTMDEK